MYLNKGQKRLNDGEKCNLVGSSPLSIERRTVVLMLRTVPDDFKFLDVAVDGQVISNTRFQPADH